MRVREAKRSKIAASLPRTIKGVSFADPWPNGGESPDERDDRVKGLVIRAVRDCYHPSQEERELIARHFLIGKPRGKHPSIAYIELVYGLVGKIDGWRCGFSVSYSELNGYRLWIEIRNHVRRL